MPSRRAATAMAAAVMMAGLVAVPATAAAAPDQEMPFGCAEQWTGSTRATHRPSPLAVDLNRPRDLGAVVVASAAGVVTRVEDTGERGYGRWVEVTHPEGYRTYYAHLAAQWVAAGQFVDQGAPLGRVGATGQVTGAHLHYEQRLGRDLTPVAFHDAAFALGAAVGSQNCPDVPLTGDWDGDGGQEVAVFRRGPRVGRFLLADDVGLLAAWLRLGRPGDLPVVGDWDGDGTDEIGVRRQAARSFLLRAGDGSVSRVRFGVVGDVPVTGDWDGDGVTDLGVYRPASRRFRLLMPDATTRVVALGGAGSQPVTGDWDGDGATDVGVFDAADVTFRLRTVGPDGVAAVTSVPVGTSTDLPVTGDWDGDGVTDLGVWAPATATYTMLVRSPDGVARRTADGAPALRTLVFGRRR